MGSKGGETEVPPGASPHPSGEGWEGKRKNEERVEEVVGEAWAWEKGGERHRDRHKDISSCSEMLWVSDVLSVGSGPALGILGPSGPRALSPCCLPPGCTGCRGLSLWWFWPLVVFSSTRHSHGWTVCWFQPGAFSCLKGSPVNEFSSPLLWASWLEGTQRITLG